MNKWMDFTNEYTQFMKGNFEVMNKFWRASMDQSGEHVKKNMELYFDHMNRNVEFMHELWETSVKSNEELSTQFRTNMEKFNDRYQKVYDETVKTFTPKEKSAGN